MLSSMKGHIGFLRTFEQRNDVNKTTLKFKQVVGFQSRKSNI